MYNSYYRGNVSQNRKPYPNEIGNPETENLESGNEVDYSFCRLPVRERRKCFQDEGQQFIPDFGRLPKSSARRSSMEVSAWQTPKSQTWRNRSQTSTRHDSSGSYQTPSLTSTRAVEHEALRRSVDASFVHPTQVRVYRRSKALYNPQKTNPNVMKVRGELELHQPPLPPPSPGWHWKPLTPATQDLAQADYFSTPRQRETMSMTREIRPSTYHQEEWNQPLRVRVYSSCESKVNHQGRATTSSPGRQQSTPSSGDHVSPVYPAYPAYPDYGPHAVTVVPQVYHVVHNPPQPYPQTIVTGYSYSPAESTTREQVPLPRTHARGLSAPVFFSKPITTRLTLRRHPEEELTGQRQQGSPLTQPWCLSGSTEWTREQPTGDTGNTILGQPSPFERRRFASFSFIQPTAVERQHVPKQMQVPSNYQVHPITAPSSSAPQFFNRRSNSFQDRNTAVTDF